MADNSIEREVVERATPSPGESFAALHGSDVADASPRRPRRELPRELDLGSYEDIFVALDPDQQTFWVRARKQGVPCFSANMLRELNVAHRTIHRLFDDREPGAPAPVKFLVACSDTPGVFSYGGDLALFRRCVQAGDRVMLSNYAYACVETMYNNAFGFDVPVTSLCVVEGDALGGGFEAALSFNYMIAERGVKMGFPETLFNSFPGMGAYSFLSRKLDIVRAEKLILSADVHKAEDLFDMGVVDILAEPGEGREAARRFISENMRRQPVLHALNRVRRRVAPLTLSELRDVTDIWVESVMALGEADLRKMSLLMAAQTRRMERRQKAR
jgi:DSF synthase